MSFGDVMSNIGGLGAPLALAVGIYATLRKTKTESQGSSAESRRADNKQFQDDLAAARAEAASLRLETSSLRKELETTGAAYRDEIADVWRQFSEFRRAADLETNLVRLKHANAEEYIATLIKWVQDGKEGEMPVRNQLVLP